MEQCCPISLFYSLPYGTLQSSKLVTCYSSFCGGLLATLAQHANQLATPALSQFIFTLSRTTFAGQHMAKRFTGCVRACVCVCVFGAVKMLPVSISHFVCSCSFNGFIFPAKLEKFSGFSLPLRVGHSTRCHHAHSQHRRLCATSAASWLLLIMCPTHTHKHTQGHTLRARSTVHTPLNCNFWQHFGLHKSWVTAVATCTVPGTCRQCLLLFLAPAWQSQVPYARANKTFAHVSSLLKSTQHIMVT